MSTPRVTETYQASAGGVLIGLVQWALATYVFHGHEPSIVTAAVFILLPGLLGGVTAFFTRREWKQDGPPANPPAATGPGPAASG